MRKKLFILAVVSLMVCVIGFVAVASACDHNRHKECKSKPERGQLCLFQKESPDPGWPELPFYGPYCLDDQTWDDQNDRGAWGKMKYNLSGRTFEFNFEGHGLPPGKSYTLIYFPDNIQYGDCYPGLGLIYLGSDIANRGGHVHIVGSLDTGDLPAWYDYNNISNNGSYNGAKIWLVLSEDLCLGPSPIFRAWRPQEYLFQEKGKFVTFEDTDNLPTCGT